MGVALGIDCPNTGLAEKEGFEFAVFLCSAAFEKALSNAKSHRLGVFFLE